VVDAEADRGHGVEQAGGGPTGDADGHAPPRPVLPGAPGPEPGPEDHHPLEADVDHAAALGEQATQGGEQDRDGEAQRQAERPERGQLGVVRDLPDDRQHEEEHAARDQELAEQPTARRQREGVSPGHGARARDGGAVVGPEASGEAAVAHAGAPATPPAPVSPGSTSGVWAPTMRRCWDSIRRWTSS
jgi:hypothetical protein